jgi:hypothetical protein
MTPPTVAFRAPRDRGYAGRSVRSGGRPTRGGADLQPIRHANVTPEPRSFQTDSGRARASPVATSPAISITAGLAAGAGGVGPRP